MKRFFLLTLIIAGINTYSRAQDLICGEVSYNYISGYNYAIQLTFYTKTSANINRDSILINWNDNSPTDTISTIKQILPNDISQYTCTKNHIFPGSGMYYISFTDSFRIPNIQNIQNSENEIFQLGSELRINIFGVNSSSSSTLPLIDTAIQGEYYQYNLGCTDPDGDSLQFELLPSINNYTLPSNLSIEASTGIITWNTPDTIGIYIIVIIADEFRNGIKFGSVVRQIMIEVISPDAIDDKIDNENIISVYPNPASETISISFLPGTVNVFYEICDITGRELERNNIIIPNQSISLKNYNNGIYFLKISMDNKIFTKKFVKL